MRGRWEETTTAVRLWSFSLFSLALGCGLAGYAAFTLEAPVGQPFQIAWPALAVMFLIAEWLDVDIEVRKEAHTLTFTEFPLTLGLILATPGDLVIARLVVSAIALPLLRRRLDPVKVVFNAGIFGVDVGLALLVFHGLLGSSSPAQLDGWIAALGAVAVSHLVSAFLVATVMRIAGAPVTWRSEVGVIGVSLSAALAGCAVAIGASGALWRDDGGRSWVLLLLIGLAIGYFFVAYMRIRERHQDLATLHVFTTSLAAHRAADEMSATVASGLAEVMRAQQVVLLIPDGERISRVELRDGEIVSDESHHDVDDIDWASAIGLAGRQKTSGGDLPSIAGVTVSDSKNLITARLPLPQRTGLIVVSGRVSSVRAFDDEDVQLLETAAGHAAAALHNAQLVDHLGQEARFRAHQALHDEVTDLPNQRSLTEQLDGQLALGSRLVMLTVRINSLREVNETLGRNMGDEMLRQVAARLRPLGRRSWCARSGTDEFTVVVPGGQEEGDMLAERVIAAFEQPVLCHDVALAVTVGVGVALAPAHGIESEMLLRRASLAASRSLLDGTTVTTWASDRDPYDPHRLTIAADLRDAIPAGELQVHFQPQMDLATGLVTSAEALVRWRHPRLGELRPDQFIPAAENTGAIDALTIHVLTVAAETAAGWHGSGWDLDVAVNLSARNLANANFADDIAAVLDAAGLPPSSLTLELTESVVMTEAERALRTLQRLHDMGISLSIDDFGTGYSSLAHLRRLPVSEIKVDKSFVFDLTTSESDEVIVKSMIDLGHNLGLSVVVEGVETPEVRSRVGELGSDRLQGYLLSRPLPGPAFEHWLADRPIRLRGDAPQGRVINLDHRR